MSKVCINKAGTGFELDGKPFFYLADTVWSAFTNATLDEWELYLRHREEQGFTYIQMNTMPQWDRQLPDLGLYPYASKDGITFDFSKSVPAFWERARAMCEMAQKHGIRPALILLWANFVPGTWIERIGKSTQTIPFGMIDHHIKMVVDNFGEYDPIYIVSGDTDFANSPETVRYYMEAARAIEAYAPEALRTFHLAGLVKKLPTELESAANFFMFQSGHVAKQDQAIIYQLSQAFCEVNPHRPVVNSEPCYEGMGLRRAYGRYGRREVRFAAWTSICSGASAGLAYGAHGIWNWKTSKSTGAYPGNIFGEPYLWQEALTFSGAWDFAYIPRLLHQLGMQALIPANRELGLETEDIRLAKTVDGRYIAYLPWTNELPIKANLENMRAYAIDLEHHFIANLSIKIDAEMSIVSQHPFTEDALVIVDQM